MIGALTTLNALGAITRAPLARRADNVAYLVNVTVRPGYNIPNADAALAYGYGICDKDRPGSRLWAALERIDPSEH